jgi:tripartite-type tricarboxylate transporter receptor subunit TctC
MKNFKLQFVTVPLLVAGLFVGGFSMAAFAQQPLKIIVPWGAGGSSDTYARTLAASMRDTLGTEILIVNKSGAAGTLGTSLVANAKPDGNTIGFSALAPYTMQPHMRNLNYDVASFDYICQPFASPMALVVDEKSKFGNVGEVIAFAKANPQKLKYGSPGPGSLPHLAMVELGLKADVEWKHLPTKGGDMGNVRNLLGGHIDMVPIQIVPLASNPIKPLAVFSNERLKELPDVPTMKELGYEVSHVVWGAMFAPKGTPDDILSKLEAACEKGVYSASYEDMLKKARVPQIFKGRTETAQFALEESEKFKGLLQKAGMAK